MDWYDECYKYEDLWKNKKGKEVTIERCCKDWITGKNIVQFWYKMTAYTMDREKFEKEFTYVEESNDYVIKYFANDGKDRIEEFDVPQRAAKFILYCGNLKTASIIEVIYASGKNYRLCRPMCKFIFWSGWAYTYDTLKEIVSGKIPEECASPYTQYDNAMKEPTKIDNIENIPVNETETDYDIDRKLLMGDYFE